MRTADLDFIKVTEVGGIVRYSSKPPEGLCYIPGVRMEMCIRDSASGIAPVFLFRL